MSMIEWRIGVFCICSTMPRQAVAGDNTVYVAYTMVHIKVKVNDTVTTKRVDQMVGGQSGTGSIHNTMPREAVANGMIFYSGVTIVNGKVERYHTVASCTVGLCVCGSRGGSSVGSGCGVW